MDSLKISNCYLEEKLAYAVKSMNHNSLGYKQPYITQAYNVDVKSESAVPATRCTSIHIHLGPEWGKRGIS
jgi:hypothetical protein